MIDIFLQNWNATVAETTQGRLFIHVKHEFGFEKYLNMPNNAHRVVITKIRLIVGHMEGGSSAPPPEPSET